MSVTMKLIENSSNLAEQGYDPATRVLRIKFKSGATYEYDGVAPETYARFTQAESMGKFLNAEIKPAHECRKVE